ncbi:MAG: DUF2796 domain-containing protein [Roseobacter sp.]
MKTLPFIAALATFAGQTLASETRQLGAHEHGVGQLDIALDGQRVAMELHVPGADIVGFEYAAKSAEDRAKVDAAVATLARPLELFLLPVEAGCSVVKASASLESENDDDHHDEDHADHSHEDHDQEEHAHDDHGEHEEHAEHDDHEHGEHQEAVGHTEFHAEYMLECADPTAVQSIVFAYFETFPNAKKIEVQVISEAGASAFDVERDAPSLDLRGMF